MRGAGLGLRRALLSPLAERADAVADFLEVAPENWMRIGGRLGRQFRALTERYAFATHGLSLSIGSPAPLDEDFVREIKDFLDRHGIADYSEHLTWCSDDGHLYDLMPIPFTVDAVDYVAARVRRVQDILERRIALENASYYAPLASELSELEFINAVVERADCDLLLDVNNVYVNSINHRYDPVQFLDGLPRERVRYMHIAGHYVEAEDLRVDTHGSSVIEPVWALLQHAYARFGVKPTLLERDFNIPPLPVLLGEVERIRTLQAAALPAQRVVNG
ncbi:HvfB family MNIO-type RiPP peptide maturase [Sinimarinibacterium thermocellulolyticum]|uniref:HvfB family MNIO-type RiPP peptide maturase n=1 Tax=Sinimarinibacterium thermocellulolyticum TaxID=3170016 RepID=UPI0033356C8D